MCTEAELKVGQVWSAKRLRASYVGCDRVWNDRQIVYLGAFTVQYDSPAVKPGQKYKTVTKAEFVKWADKDVSSYMPKGDWRSADV